MVSRAAFKKYYYLFIWRLENNMFLSVILFQTLFLAISCNEQSKLYKDNFHEELFIKPLFSGHVYAYFQFTTLWEYDSQEESYQHCHLFPQPLAEVLNQHDIQEMHLSLTSGLWRHEKWGYPVISAPPGAELWAWFKDGTEKVDQKWQLFASALSGLFCASLNFINKQQSANPTLSFLPLGSQRKGSHNSSHVRYSSLPREIVCTENLTPFKKLLPCDSKKGLASLLNAGFVHNANYHSLGVHVRPQCQDSKCEKVNMELTQTVSLVYDLLTLSPMSQDWSIRKLFGIGLSGPCPLASTSKIYIDYSTNQTASEIYKLTPEPTETLFSERGGYRVPLAVYDVKKMNIAGSYFNIGTVHTSSRLFSLNSPPILQATRFIVGYGQEHGGIVTKIHNSHWKELDVVYLENIPWYIPVYYHTVKVTTSKGEIIKPVAKHYMPGRERSQPYFLELLIRLPARTVSEISLEFDYNFLKWQEYPPDANHGFYVGSAVIAATLPHTRNYSSIPIDGSLFSSSFNASREGYAVTLHTEILIVTLPTPDFSMPYNVICLACTVVALAFGPLHNHTTKMLMLRDDSKKINIKSRMRLIISKLSDWHSTGEASQSGETEDKGKLATK